MQIGSFVRATGGTHKGKTGAIVRDTAQYYTVRGADGVEFRVLQRNVAAEDNVSRWGLWSWESVAAAARQTKQGQDAAVLVAGHIPA